MYDAAQMQLFSREQGETLVKVKAHLMTKHAFRASASAVGLNSALVEDVLKEVEILFHVNKFVQKYK